MILPRIIVFLLIATEKSMAICPVGNIISIPDPTGMTNINSSLWDSEPSFYGQSDFINSSLNLNQFEMEELNTARLSAGFNISDGIFTGIGISHLGNELFSESALLIQSSFSVANHISFGSRLVFFNRKFKNYGNYQNIKINLGGKISIGEEITAGIQFKNFDILRQAKGVENIPLNVSVGINWKIDKYFSITISSLNDINYRSGLAVSAKFEYEDIIRFRTSWQNAPEALGIEAGFCTYGNLHFCFGTIYHNSLGLSPEISFEWVFD